MCGIFGFIASETCQLSRHDLKSVATRLLISSESRGKEAAGISLLSGDEIKVLKMPLPAYEFVKKPEYNHLFDSLENETAYPLALVGHTRLMTNGTMELNGNNQPVATSDALAVHNGIIVNDNDLWKEFEFLNRQFDVDTELLVKMFRHFYEKSGNLKLALKNVFLKIKGSVSFAGLMKDNNNLILATNTGSIFKVDSQDKSAFYFMSEKYLADQVVHQFPLKKYFKTFQVTQIPAGSGCLVNLQSQHIDDFELDNENKSNLDSKFDPPFKIKEMEIKDGLVSKLASIPKLKTNHFKHINPSDQKLRRCNKCILPETMPFIEFDEKGICNFCNTYTQVKIKGLEALQKKVEPFRKPKGQGDCLVPISGGRDSCFGLHYVKNILGMNPVAYTYDWGMVTDLARRNTARMCGKLGVEHITVSADILKKRDHIRKNVIAWLKKPELGMIPLFMAGDKQFFYYANVVGKQIGTNLIFFSENKLERTNFKEGFCGINNLKFSNRTHALHFSPLKNKLLLAGYYGKNFLTNPAYLNSSLFDSFHAYFTTYFLKNNFEYVFEHHPWHEEEIMSLIKNEYDWEFAEDTTTSWRIGDGTAPFYNYIYYKAAGFSEHDTFLSNQIREGFIDRATALERSDEANRPRFPSIKEYLDLIHLNFDEVMLQIEKFKPIYPK